MGLPTSILAREVCVQQQGMFKTFHILNKSLSGKTFETRRVFFVYQHVESVICISASSQLPHRIISIKHKSVDRECVIRVQYPSESSRPKFQLVHRR